MHFHSLLPVEITTVTEDTETDLQIATAIAFLEVLLQRSKRNIVAQIQLERLKRLRNSFSRAVDEAVVTAMLPYDENSEDPKYQEFEDHTDRLKHEYENEKVNCIKMPDGRIFEEDHYVVRNKFVIRDGKVCSAIAGPLGHIKRTKKSKKATALMMVPRTKIYKSLKEYAERGCHVPFNEKYQAYGYTYNPNGRWDWYEIGGRWPGTFLVKDDLGYIDADISESWKASFPAPDGYIWVDAARKKDIAWDVMRQWHTEKVKSEYAELQDKISHSAISRLQKRGSCISVSVSSIGMIRWKCICPSLISLLRISILSILRMSLLQISGMTAINMNAVTQMIWRKLADCGTETRMTSSMH